MNLEKDTHICPLFLSLLAPYISGIYTSRLRGVVGPFDEGSTVSKDREYVVRKSASDQEGVVCGGAYLCELCRDIVEREGFVLLRCDLYCVAPTQDGRCVPSFAVEVFPFMFLTGRTIWSWEGELQLVELVLPQVDIDDTFA